MADTYWDQVFAAHRPTLREYLSVDMRPGRRELFGLVTDGVSVGLPLPASVELGGSVGGASSLYLWMDSPREIEPWSRRLGLAWEPVRM